MAIIKGNPSAFTALNVDNLTIDPGKKPASKLGDLGLYEDARNIRDFQVPHKPPRPSTTEIRSMPSVAAYHSTLFTAFRLEANSVYNFYTEDEQAVPVADPSSSLSDIPRYVELSWNIAPVRHGLKVGDKRVRVFLRDPLVKDPAIKFSEARTAVANGYVAPGVISALLSQPIPPPPPPRFDEDAFLFDPTAGGEYAFDHVGDEGSQFTTDLTSPEEPFRVNFVDPSIAGVLDKNRVEVANDPLHLTTLASLTKIVAGLEVISEFNQDVKPQNPPPEFSSPSDLPALSYIGYVIERYDLSPQGGMRLGRTIEIDDPTVDFIVDREVVYGGRYIYRIRAIAQWVHPWDIDFEGFSTIDRMQAFSPVSTNFLAAYYAGDWSDWARTQVLDNLDPDPPDEMTVRPLDGRKEVHVSWRMPNDPQQDLASFRLLRATVTDGRVSDWAQIGEFVPRNGLYIDRDVSFVEETRQEYMYAMYSVSYHGNFSHLSEQVRVAVGRHRSPPVVQVRGRGADPMAHPTRRRARGSTEMLAGRQARILCRTSRSRHPLQAREYVMDIRSLSTGERVRVALDVDATDVKA